VSEPLATSFARLLAEIEEAVEAQAAWPSPETGFAAMVMHSADAASPALTAIIGQAVASFDAVAETRWAEAPVLAAEGYALHLEPDPERSARWLAGAARLGARDPFPADRNSFFYRPVELLGVALGAGATAKNDVSTKVWLTETIKNGENGVATDPWHLIPTAIAAHVLGAPGPTARLQLEAADAGTDELALTLWLMEAWPTVADDLRLPPQHDLETALMLKSASSVVVVGDLARASVVYVALRRLVEQTLRSALEESWQLDRSTRDAVSLVVEICRRFPLFVRELATRYDRRVPIAITDEYDVQDTVRALTRLHFDDVRPEENVPSYAGTRTRMDFLLKRECIVVETKMTRASLKQQRVVAELIQDKAHYATHPGCKTLVCFVYDPNRLLDNPTALIDDLSDETETLRTVVVVSH
jgi:hypothetical protein